MIARPMAASVLLMTAAVLQTALFPSLELLGFRPDLVLLVVVAVALTEGPGVGAACGASGGLLSDLLTSQAPAGLGILVLTGLGYAVGRVRPYLAPGSVSAPLLLAFVSGALGTAGYGALTSLLGDDRVGAVLVARASLSVAVYNTLLAPAVVGVVRRLRERLPAPASPRSDRAPGA